MKRSFSAKYLLEANAKRLAKYDEKNLIKIQAFVSSEAKRYVKEYKEKNSYRNIDIALDKIILEHKNKKG